MVNEFNERYNDMYEKKQINLKSPDLSKLQVVVIDSRTRIYVALGTDPEEAKIHYIAKLEAKNTFYSRSRKPIVT
jgi:hypothetical protein